MRGHAKGWSDDVCRWQYHDMRASIVGRVLPGPIAAVEAFSDDPDERCFPGEEDLVAKAGAARRGEFITARRCARQALQLIGRPAVAIRPGPRREPRWPSDIVGSITHCPGYRAAAIASASSFDGIGIDAEPHRPLPPRVVERITAAGEPEMLAGLHREHPDVHWDRLLFSAKEAVYKAWFPLTRRWLGLRDARLFVDAATCTFGARLVRDEGRITDERPPVRFHGSFLVDQDLVLTAVTVPNNRRAFTMTEATI